MNDQIKSEKEFHKFYQNYLQGDSKLSEIYQQSEEISPSDLLDKTILAAAKKYQVDKHEAGKHDVGKQELSRFYLRSSSPFYSLAASVAVFSLASLLIFNTWEVEKSDLEEQTSELYSSDYQVDTRSDIMPIEGLEKSSPMSNIMESNIMESNIMESNIMESNNFRTKNVSLSPKQALRGLIVEEKELISARALQENNTQRLSSPLVQGKIKRSFKQLAQEKVQADTSSDVSKNNAPKLKKMNFSSITTNTTSDSIRLNVSKAQIWLYKIEKMIKNKHYAQAKIEFSLFRKSYPDFPINSRALQLLQSDLTLPILK